MGSIFGGPKPPQGKSSASSQTTPGRGTGAQILLGDDTSLDISEVESIVNSSASVKDLAVFQMQIRLERSEFYWMKGVHKQRYQKRYAENWSETSRRKERAKNWSKINSSNNN